MQLMDEKGRESERIKRRKSDALYNVGLAIKKLIGKKKPKIFEKLEQ